MQISVMPYSFARDMRSGSMSLPGFFAACAELGADGVEISNSDVARLGEEAVRELLAQHQLDFPTYIISKDFVTEDEARFRRAVQEMRDEIDRGKRLGASKVMLSTGSPKADIADDRARERIGEALRVVAQYGQQVGVIVTTENHGGLAQFRGRLSQMVRFLEQAPLLSFTVDDGNFLLAGENPLAALERLYPRVVHMHLKDFKAVSASDHKGFPVPGQPDQVYVGTLLGEGEVGTEQILRYLCRRGYCGYLTIEYSGEAPDRTGVAQAVEFIRRIWSDEGCTGGI